MRQSPWQTVPHCSSAGGGSEGTPAGVVSAMPAARQGDEATPDRLGAQIEQIFEEHQVLSNAPIPVANGATWLKRGGRE